MTYKVFTREFDSVVGAETLARPVSIEQARAFAKVEAGFAHVRNASVGDAPTVCADAVVSILIDHSGSMRGPPAALTIGLVEAIAEYLYRRGVPSDILGFTTVTWKGGRSREKWLATGRPVAPGRLNDLLHIVYRSAGEPPGPAPASLRAVMLDEETLKENIDGEAIEWAASRLRQRPERNKILVLLSDGAPVDDSTLSVNTGHYLDDHFRDVVASLRAEGAIRVAAVGIGYRVSSDLFGDGLIIGNTGQAILAPNVAAMRVLYLIRRLLERSPEAGVVDGPLAEQIADAAPSPGPATAVRSTTSVSTTSVPSVGRRVVAPAPVDRISESRRQLHDAMATADDANWTRGADATHAELVKTDLAAAARLRHAMALAIEAYSDRRGWRSGALDYWFKAAAREISILSAGDLPAATRLLEEMADQASVGPSTRKVFAEARKGLREAGVVLDYGSPRITRRRVDLANSAIEAVPDDVGASLRLDVSGCRRLKRLPAHLSVGVLFARNCVALETLPPGLLASYVDLTGCSALTALPADMKVAGGYLRLRGCARLRQVPRGLGPLTHLDIADCLNITALPDDLAVTGSIDIGGSGVRALPMSLAHVQIRWRGVPIDARTAFHPETLTAGEILAERNAEVRRVKIERFGLEKLMASADVAILDEDRDAGGPRRLLQIPVDDDEPLVCVSVSCPSTGRRYMLRVPPTMTTCRQAIAWTAGFDDPDDYRPQIET